jgi:hypothetical protein
MIRTALLGSCLILTATTGVAAELVTVPLDLGGETLYLLPFEVQDLAFDAGRELPDITDVRLHVTGTYGNARSICWNFGAYGGGTWTYTEDHGLVLGFVDGPDPCCLTPQVLLPAMAEVVPYERTLDFDCGADPVDWTHLADGTGVVRLTGLECEYHPSYPEVCLCEHSATVTSAELLITLGTGVAVERSDWSSIKGLCR